MSDPDRPRQKLFSPDAARGLFVGGAIGEAMGLAAAPGQYGAITVQAMCQAQMLRSANGWDAQDVMRRMINWRDHGYLSPTRTPFGMSDAIVGSLERYEVTGNPYSGGDVEDPEPLGRLGAVVLAYGAKREAAEAVGQLQARLTHGRMGGAAAHFAGLLVSGETPPQPPEPGDGEGLRAVLQSAFWAASRGANFAEVMEAAAGVAQFGGALGALAGLLAGRRFGYDAIPEDWRNGLMFREKIVTAADDLYVLRPIDL